MTGHALQDGIAASARAFLNRGRDILRMARGSPDLPDHENQAILCPERLRNVLSQFSWIDQRLVRESHIQGRSPEALALYLLLCTIADAQGASYYSDATAGNLKTGVLEHRLGQQAVFHPRFLDFAAHYRFEPRACTVRKAIEKGRVENFVGYVKKNLLAGLDLPKSLSAINTAARHWLDTIANSRTHKETRSQPNSSPPPKTRPASAAARACRLSAARTVRVTNRCRVVQDTNRYTVPHLYASQQLISAAGPVAAGLPRPMAAAAAKPHATTGADARLALHGIPFGPWA